MTDKKQSGRASKSIGGASEINVDNDYKSGCTVIVAFGKTKKNSDTTGD